LVLAILIFVLVLRVVVFIFVRVLDLNALKSPNPLAQLAILL
jgi:hypothetical protein